MTNKTNKTVLLVEDNPDDEILILRELRRAGIVNNVMVTRDGAEALDLLFGTGAYEERGACKPVLVLLDLKLPKIDGLEVLERLRGDARTKLIPVVILTSSDDENDIARGYELGVNSYVRKPVDFAEFSKAVTELGLYWLILNELPPGAG